MSHRQVVLTAEDGTAFTERWEFDVCPTCLDEGEVEFCPAHPGRVCPCRVAMPCPDCTPPSEPIHAL